ncbi:D-alanyl-D-alanine carboxypeptidase family protein [Clostridium sp. BJN0013]|uniref:D-alanyl-D-alanine carboxypeptidase family protein n=1 Tax=Clostridium sp. BJN0013 TaxID=3236840 RepID=UPI0034C6667B
MKIVRLEKIYVYIITFFIVFNNIYCYNVFAEGEDKAFKAPNIDARCAVAIDSNSKVVVYEKNAYELVPMASTTKIMTALVAMKYGDLNKKLDISPKAASVRGSTVGYKKGESILLKELLYGLMLRSGNDAAIAIAEGISGSVEEFAELMNEYASELGVINTQFKTPHGLDSEGHYSTAYDLALVTSIAKKEPLFNEIVGSKDVDGEKNKFTRSYHNINKILWQIPEANGVKTGYTGKAGKCLVTSVTVQKNDIIIVVLNSPRRWEETNKIYEYVNKNYKFVKLFSKDDIAAELKVSKNNLKLQCESDIILPIKNGFKYTTKIIKPQKIGYTVKKGDKIGMLCVYENDKKIYSTALIASKDVKVRRFMHKIFGFRGNANSPEVLTNFQIPKYQAILRFRWSLL